MAEHQPLPANFPEIATRRFLAGYRHADDRGTQFLFEDCVGLIECAPGGTFLILRVALDDPLPCSAYAVTGGLDQRDL